jgi:hypothetical protein
MTFATATARLRAALIPLLVGGGRSGNRCSRQTSIADRWLKSISLKWLCVCV